MKERQPQIGDIVEVTWRDHFVYRGELPEKKMEVKTWGRFSHDEPDGYAITMSEVQGDLSDPSVEHNMTGQWIYKESVVNIRILK